jgi:hypothetical protein
MTVGSGLPRIHWLKQPRAPMARGSFVGEYGANQHHLLQPEQTLPVLVYACRGLMTASRIGSACAAVSSDCEGWSFLDEGVLRSSRSRKVCMTCHWCCHHTGAECIPVLTCQLHRGQIAQGEHLIRHCQGWTDDMVRQRGWAPEVS